MLFLILVTKFVHKWKLITAGFTFFNKKKYDCLLEKMLFLACPGIRINTVLRIVVLPWIHAKTLI